MDILFYETNINAFFFVLTGTLGQFFDICVSDEILDYNFNFFESLYKTSSSECYISPISKPKSLIVTEVFKAGLIS